MHVNKLGGINFFPISTIADIPRLQLYGKTRYFPVKMQLWLGKKVGKAPQGVLSGKETHLMRYTSTSRWNERDSFVDNPLNWLREKLPSLGCMVAILLVIGACGGSLTAIRLTQGVHWLWLAVILHPIGLTLFVITVALTILSFVAGSNEWTFRSVLYIAAVLMWVVLFGYGFLADGLYHKYLVQDQNPTTIASLADSNAARWMPYEVAQQYGVNRYQESSTVLQDFEPIQTADGQITWVAPREPNGLVNSLNAQTQGVAVIRNDGTVQLVNSPFKYGEGMLFGNSYSWHLLQLHYNVQLDNPYYVFVGSGDSQQVLMLVPYERFKWEFPVNVPYWGGVFVVHPDGTIEDLTPAQAVADPRFTDQRLYPEELAREISQAWAYKGGIANYWFQHRDQVEIPTIDNSTNQQPYLLPTTQGPEWVVAAEPHGQSYGVFKLFVWSAHDGSMSVLSLPSGSSLIGPNKAARYVQSPLPQIQWASDKGGKITLLEPRPIVRSGVLYWQLTATTTDNAGVTLTALVDSRSGDIRIFRTPDQLVGFLQGTYEGETPEQYTTGGVSGSTSSTAPDISKMTDKELIQLLQQIAAELAKRQSK